MKTATDYIREALNRELTINGGNYDTIKVKELMARIEKTKNSLEELKEE